MTPNYKEKLRFMIVNWDKMSPGEMCEKLGISKQTLVLWASKCRKAGIPLKKHITGSRKGSLAIKELAEEFKNQ